MNDKKKSTLPMILGCAALFILILTLGIGVMLGGEGEEPTIAPTAGMTASAGAETASGSEMPAETAQTQTVTETGTAPQGESRPDPVTEPSTADRPGTEPSTAGRPGTEPPTTGRPGTQPPTEGPTEPPTKPATEPVTRPTTPVVQEPVTVPQQTGASYERWLSAGMVVGLSMSYPDFQLQEIYVAGETPLEDKMNSGGACIFFTSGGKALVLCSAPLEAERKTPGTIDLSSQTIGFATFDVVDAATVDTTGMTRVAVTELGELIEQSMLVSLYWN